jgi:hypothetical protein
METIESKIINDYLFTLEKVPLSNAPLFRLSWSDEQLELRICTQRLYLGNTFIREIKSTERVPKYPFIDGRWIFEQWYPPELVACEELPESTKGDYVCLYVFDKRGEPLPLNLHIIQFLVYQIRKPKSSSALIQSTIHEEMQLKEEELDKLEMEYLDVSTDIQSNLHFGEGIIVPANYDVISPNLRGKSN